MKRFARHLSALLDGVEFTADSELAKAGTQALVTYAWAKKHAKGPEGVGLRFSVVQMTRAIKKAMNRRKPAPSTPDPSPAPADNIIPKTGDDDDLPEDPGPRRRRGELLIRSRASRVAALDPSQLGSPLALRASAASAAKTASAGAATPARMSLPGISASGVNRKTPASIVPTR
jgi:hypothetical protein